MMNISVKPAQYTDRGDSYQVQKNGYVVIDFTPVTENSDESGQQQRQIDSQNKKTVIITQKTIGDLLILDTLPYSPQADEEGSFVQYQTKPEEPIRVLKMNKQETGKAYKFSYCEIDPSTNDIKSTLAIEVTYGELLNIQTLLRFASPYLLGWHAMANPSVVSV